MIPIKLKRVKLDINTIEGLEFKYLVEISQDIQDKYKERLEEDQWSDENKLLQLFTNNEFAKYKYIGKVEGVNLFINRYGDFYTVDKDVDFLYFERGYSDDDWGFVLSDEVLKDMVGKKLDVDYSGYGDIREIFEKYENKEMCVGDFIQRFLAYGFKEERAELKREKLKVIKVEEEIKGNKIDIEEFNKGEWKTNDNNVYGSKNVIYNYKEEYTFSKDFAKLLTIEELNNSYRNYSRYGGEKLNWIEMLCVKKKVSYAFISGDKKRTYSVKFIKDKMYVDGVVIPVSRSSFFISRADGDTETLKKFKELSAVKVEFLALTSISISTNSYTYRDIPFEVKYTDKLFEITLLDKTIKSDWKGLEMFRYNLQSLKTQFSTQDINKIRELFDISKGDMFDFMKKTQILDKLGEND